ncbi:MAG: ACP S-malonyltransferase [Magnetococcales bacterium]|nr:ACP S-malonyltransferase [Magnetococcales bacterium]MBF0322761.1 ACP S-malonyltransferase [Magnetococcales bacterium]
MGKRAFLFPGQGAQAVGMGQALLACGELIGDVFSEADRVLGFSLSRLMLEGPEAKLTLTENTQPALVTTAMAAFRLVLSKTGLRPDYVAGHSLGEYAAVCAAGGITFAEAVALVRLRGQSMQQAVPVGVGAMAAILNLPAAQVEEVCRQSQAETGGVCVAANYNSSAQIVISGHKHAVEKAVEMAKGAGAKRSVMLAVSAPFHCPLMEPAARQMSAAMEKISFKDLSAPLVSNVTAREVSLGDEVRKGLVQAITAPVMWEAIIHRLVALGVDLFIELGTGKVLSGMVKRIDKNLAVFNVSGPEDLAALPAA